jgi:type III pantothenate kinase
MVTLCFDFGNTRLKYAVFDNNSQRLVEVLPNDAPATLEAILDQYLPGRSILSSVINSHILHSFLLQHLWASRRQ